MSLRNNTLEEFIRMGKQFLKEKNIAEYSLEAQILVMKVTGFNKTEIYIKNEYILTNKEIKTYYEYLNKRADGVPIQYIVGVWEFMGIDFFVKENVLIPRPDTEILVESVIEYSKLYDIETVIDIGTGTGCIPISLLKNGMGFAYAVDINKDALELAKFNAQKNGVSEKISFIESDLLNNIDNKIERLDAVISNPPYIPTKDIENLMVEVRCYEPRNALDGGEDGLVYYRKITSQSRCVLKEHGFIFFEIGYNQGEDVRNILYQEGYSNIIVKKDLSGNDRVVIARLENID